MNPKYVLALILVLTPTVYGCVNFQSEWFDYSSGGKMVGSFWDNSAQGTPDCTINDIRNPDDGLFHMFCTTTGLAVTINADGFSDDFSVRFTYPGTDLTFDATQSGTSSQYWTCKYDCSASGSCFVPFG